MSDTNILLALGGILFVIIIVVVLLSLVAYLIKAISFFMMGQKAGVPYSWLSFIPIAQYYVPMVLPHRDYELLFVKPKKRITAFWIFLVLQVAYGAMSGIASSINQVQSEISMAVESYDETLGIIGIVIALISLMASLVLFLFGLATELMKMRMHIDLFRTYGMEGGAIALSVIGIFIPIVPMVAYLFLIGKEPEYGCGNYAQEFREVPYAGDNQEEYFDYN